MDVEQSTNFPTLNIMGYLMFFVSLVMNIWNKFYIKNINETIVLITSAVALVFMLYKVILIHYEYI